MKYAVALVVGVLLLAGCGGADSDTPEPITAGLNTMQQNRIALEAYLRSVDPCGLLDEAEVARYGMVEQYGPLAALSACNAMVLPPGGPQIRVELMLLPTALSETSKSNPGGMDGVEVYGGRGPDIPNGTCEKLFRLSLGDLQERVDPQLAAIRVNGNRGTDTCQLAESVLAAAVKRMVAGMPKRGVTQFPLVANEPCGLWSDPRQFPRPRLVVTVDGAPKPFECTAELGDDGPRVTLAFGIRPASTAGDTETKSADGCTVTHETTQIVDITRPGARVNDVARALGRNAAIVTVSAPDCALAQAQLVDAKDRFRLG